jgi:hypothetical protein
MLTSQAGKVAFFGWILACSRQNRPKRRNHGSGSRPYHVQIFARGAKKKAEF